MQQAIEDRRLEDLIKQVESGTLRMTETDAIGIAGRLFASGRHKYAENVCRQFIKVKPENADAHSILGVSLNAQGKGKEGIASLRQAVKLAPKVARYRSNLGEIYRQQGNLAEAMVELLEAVTLDPRNARAHNNLGIVRYDSRNYDDAIESYRKAIALQPDFAEAHNNLGNALRRVNGEKEAAVEAYENALGAREIYPEAYNNLGTLLREMGKGEQAEYALRKAITQNPAYVDARNNLAHYYLGAKQEVEALRQLGEALKIAPRDVRALIMTARVQARRANFALAEKACRQALAAERDNAEALSVLGLICHETDRHPEAVQLLARAVELAPGNPETLNYYGVALKSVGRLDEAREHILKSIELNHDLVGAFANLNDLVDYSKEKELFKRLEKIATTMKGRSAETRMPLHYAYAKALDDNGQHEKALEQYIEGAKIKRAQLDYRESEIVEFFADVRKTFTAELFRNPPFEGNPTDRLLFIVGMPRSGSTLVEQIMASHSQVHGAGEVKYLSLVLNKLRDRFPSLSRYPAMTLEMKPSHFKLVADGYEQAMLGKAGDARIVTDKLLTNYFFLGMIHLMFPNARFINTRRDPVDSCLSAFTKLFKDDMPHSYDMGELGRYYRQYDAIMKHWEKVLPKRVMKVVEYENVVADMEKEARSIIDFMGLEWEDGVLEFHKSSRPVKTASVAQVRKPIYNTAVKRWKKYGPGLQPLVDAIEKP